MPTLVLAIGLTLSILAALQIEMMIRRQDSQRFSQAVEEAQLAIRTRLDTYLAVLRAADALFAAHKGHVDHTTFHAFARELDLTRAYPGIQGLGYSAALPAVSGPATEARLRELGDPGLRIRPSYPRREVHAIVHLEPMDRRNQAAMGYDMYSHPVRRAAMARARDTGRSAMSGKVELVQEIDEAKQAGFLIYRPVYRSATPPTVAGRRAQLLGFVYAPFRAGDLLEGIFGPHPRLHFAVYDMEPNAENLLHKSFPDAPQDMGRQARLAETRELVIGGRRWVIAYYSTPAFESDFGHWLSYAFLVGGLLASLLIAGATWWQARARLAAEAEIASRRAQEHQRQLLVGELNHRVKNTLATVQSIAALALREGKNLREARDTFEARLLALSQTHDLLTRDNWRGAELSELARLELAPYRAGDGARVVAEGEPVFLSPETALALGMALHELATNAVKYGALSTSAGRVRLNWDVAVLDGQPRLRISWQEEGGPKVAPPQARGFGTRLIATGLRRQLNGEVELVFEPSGLRCRIDVPLKPVERVPKAEERASAAQPRASWLRSHGRRS